MWRRNCPGMILKHFLWLNEVKWTSLFNEYQAYNGYNDDVFSFYIAYNDGVFYFKFLLLQLEKAINAVGNVEVWLMELLKQAQWSLHVVIRDCSIIIRDPSFNLMDFFNTNPAQVSLFHDSERFNYLLTLWSLNFIQQTKNREEEKQYKSTCNWNSKKREWTSGRE